MLRRWPLFWLFAVLTAGNLTAEKWVNRGSSVTGSHYGRTLVAQFQQDTDYLSETQARYRVHIQPSGTQTGGTVFIVYFTGSNPPASGYYGESQWNAGDSNNLVISGPFVVATGSTRSMTFAWRPNSSTPSVHEAAATYTFEAVGLNPPPPEPDTYGITLQIPANPTDRAIFYMALQNGEAVGSFSQPAGASSTTLYVGNLETNDPVSLIQVTGGFITGTAEDGYGLVGEGSPYGPPTEYVIVGAGEEPGGETSPGEGSTSTGGTTTAPVISNSSTATTPTTAPTEATPTTAPTAQDVTVNISAPTATTKTTPSGTGGATKADIEASANQVTDAVDTVASKVVETANNVKTATDKVAAAVTDGASGNITATDKVAAAVVNTGTKAIEAANKAQTTFDQINSHLKTAGTRDALSVAAITGLGTKLDAVNTALNTGNANTQAILDHMTEQVGLESDADEAATTAATAASSNSSERTSAASAASSALPDAVTGIPYTPSVSGGSADFLEISMPAAFGGATVNFNPFANSGMATIAEWFRSATLWLALLLLGQFIFGQLKMSLDTVATARQATGNPVVGGTGAQATAAVNAGLITAAALVLITALVAFSFESLDVPALISNLGTNPLTGMSADVYWFLDQFIPCATLITCAVARAAWHLYAGPVIATYITLCRFFIA